MHTSSLIARKKQWLNAEKGCGKDILLVGCCCPGPRGERGRGGPGHHAQVPQAPGGHATGTIPGYRSYILSVND